MQEKLAEKDKQDVRQPREAIKQPTLADLLSVVTNSNPVRRAFEVIKPEPIQIPLMTNRFDLAILKRARENEAQRKIADEAIAAQEKKEAESADAEQQKINAANNKTRSDNRMLICNYIVSNFVARLKDVADQCGDSVTSEYKGILTRGPLTNAPRIQMIGNTNWSFDVGVLDPWPLSGRWGPSDRLVISLHTNMAMAAVFSINDRFVHCRLIGAQSKLTTAEVEFSDPRVFNLLTDFIDAIDAKHPMTIKQH